MKSEFENIFSKLQKDMVAICLEYVDFNAEDVFIYCSYESGLYQFDVFFKINGKIVHKHKLNDAIKELNNQNNKRGIDVSIERQRFLLEDGIAHLKLIHEKFKVSNHNMPSEIKLHYNVKQNRLKEKYKYDSVYSSDTYLLNQAKFDLWFKEVEKTVI
ncbi:DUF600 domain-containing protein [Bacillus sp. ISL-45]|uniref:DUF600 domain-containing protein n=1 Tax=Bacillus sp. ISL-45 TaxID=2819128 RepID=UPI001BEB22E8|nr:DUF600 domain-containing protein [Bacillus sp. ISL-45]MBT2663870.1 DUF600 domain-containing protein [Bacillus sp. ISL-45]